MVERYFPQAEYEERWARTYQEMRRRGYETAVVFSRGAGAHEHHGDLLYLTNYYSTASGQEPDNDLLNARSFAAAILRLDQEPELHTDIPGHRPELHATSRLHGHYDPIAGLVKGLQEQGINGPVAIVGTQFLPVKYYRQLEAATPQIEWQPEDDLVQSVRRIKSPRELAMYREGGAIASEALNRMIGALIDGQKEADAAALAADVVIRAGGSFLMMPCSHGDQIEYWCRNPLNGYSLDAPKAGELVRGWVLGPIYQGYYFDPGRTAVCGGKPSQAQKELVEGCAGLVDRLVSELRPGKRIMELAELGEQLTRELGGGNDQASEQWPLYGHALGLFWEDPYIGTKMCKPDDRVEENMVFGIESFLGHPGVGSAGFEQNVIVTRDGPELITTSPMIWW